MQPSNQLKGLVESYNSVYANRQELEEAKLIAETVINSVGVYMVEQGYSESDVKDFFKTSSIAKIDDVVEEALNSQSVQPYLNESVLFETHLRYIPGAMATRMKNESPEIVYQLAQSIVEFIDLPGGKSGEKYGRGVRKQAGDTLRGLARFGRGARDMLGSGIKGLTGQKTTSTRGADRAANLVTRTLSTPARTAAGFVGGAARGLMGGGSKPATPKTDRLDKDERKAKATPATDRLDKDERKQRAQSKSSTSASSGGGGSSTAPAKPAPAKPAAAKPAPAAPKKDNMASKSKAERMSAFAKANPKLAARQAERDRTRGTSATTNPMLKDRKSSMPAPDKKVSSGRLSKALASVKPMKKEDVDELDMVVQYLVSEGISDSLESALTVVEGLSDQFINSILEQCYLGYAMVEHLIQNEEASTVEEANYIISELDEENLNLLIQSITEGGMTVMPGPRAYIRVGGPEKKGDTRVSGIGPIGTYARQTDRLDKDERMQRAQKAKPQTMKMTADGKPRKY
tara:strand:- start:5985 stop:7532 length:1548 start_codon:yes stop_codon:yes gene_type:complete